MDNSFPLNIENTKPHFDISAYVVKQLGDELISDEVTALMELVKNSYDADADYVNIVIDTNDKLSGYDLNFSKYTGYILIEDNGDGMKESEIERGWLTISVSKKRTMKANGESTPKGRTPLGEKGLGRLSTQRLASKMELFTNHEKEPSAFHVYFNWDDFTEETLLTKVNVEVKPIEKSKIKKGTSLILLDIKNPSVWLGDDAEKIKGKLSQLIFPKKRKRPFSIYLTINGKSIDLDFVSDNIKELAVSRYSFSFYNKQLTILGEIKLPKLKGNDKANFIHLIDSDKGKRFFEFISNPKNKKAYLSPCVKYKGKDGVFIDFKRTISLEDISDKKVVKDNSGNDVFLDPGYFRGKIDEYNFSKDTIDISPLDEIFKEFGQYTSYIQNQIGVRVFRDGFGIRPFGLDGEDWLKLNQEQTSGSSFYGLRPGNIIGFIEIGAKSNPYLLEKTDREGLIDNFFYVNFYTITKRVIKEINSLLEDIKRAYNLYRKQYGVDNSGLDNQADVFNLMKKTGEDAEKLIGQAKILDVGISKVQKAVKEQIRLAKEQPLFSSDTESRLQPLLKSVEDQLEKSQKLLSDLSTLLNSATKLNKAVNLLEPQFTTLQDQLAEFSQLAGLGIIAEALSHEIDNILDNLVQKSRSISKYIKEKKIGDSNLHVFIEYVNNSIVSLRKQVSHLSPSLKYIREEKDQVQMKGFIDELKDFYQEKFDKEGILFDYKIEENFSIKFNKGKLSQIFDNIILNSLYWLKEYEKTKKISPKITVKVSKPLIQISDNGLGIDPVMEERLFQPFVSSKPKKTGRGLGLFIVQQLLESTGCDAILLPERNKNGRRYIFQINFSNVLK